MDVSQKAKASKVKNLCQSGMFLIFEAKKAFTELKQAFIKAPILNHYNSGYHIKIKTNVSGYAISRIFSQLNLDNLG